MPHDLVSGSLGAWALLLAKSVLVSALALATARACRGASAAVRHLVLAGGVAVLLLLPLASALQPRLDLAWLQAARASAVPQRPVAATPVAAERDAIPRAGAAPAPSAAGAAPAAAGLLADVLPPRLNPLRVLAAVLATPALLLALGLALSLVKLRELRRGGRALDLPVVEELRGALDLRRPVAVAENVAVSVPITFGLRRPAVLLPAGAARWPPAAMRAVLVHELAHVRRLDWIWQLAGRLACLLYWANPLVWVLVRRLGQEAEQACDDAVLRREPEAEGYARQLVELARSFRRRRLVPLAAVAMARPSGLASRIDALLDGSRDRRPASRRALSAMAVAAVLLAAVVAPARLVRAEERAERAAERAETRARPASGGAGASDIQGRLLYEAVEAGDVETVRRLLAAGFPVNAAVSGDGSPLIAAVRSHDFELLELLVGEGADVDLGVSGDGSPLIVAAARGDLGLVDWLLERGAGPDVAVGGDGSPLIQAAGQGELRVVRRLLEAGATIDLVVPGDENPLIAAAGAGRLDVVRFLVESGAAVNARVIANRWYGDGRLAGGEVRTPLSMAEKGGHADVARYLRSVGATRDGDPELQLPHAFAERPPRSTTSARPAAEEGPWVRLEDRWVVVPNGRVVRFTGTGSLEWPRPGRIRVPAGHAVVLDGDRVRGAVAVAGERGVTLVDGSGRVQWRVAPATARDLQGQGTRISDSEPRSARIDSRRTVTFFIAMATDGTATYFSPQRPDGSDTDRDSDN